MKRIGIIDADLLDGGTRQTKLGCLKLAGYYNNVLGEKAELIEDYKELDNGGAKEYDHIFLARVFDFTSIPDGVLLYPNLSWGGTGFPEGFKKFEGSTTDIKDLEKAGFMRALPYEVEHVMPDYHLYDTYIEHQIAAGVKPSKFKDYQEFSIGFATRGCFRHCPFCVNAQASHVMFHAHVSEFFDPERKRIYLWDDNILGYPRWRDVFDELAETGKRFQFRQGMDIRLLTDAKAQALTDSKYYGDIIFAFDHLEDAEYIKRGLRTWHANAKKARLPKLYVLTGYASQGADDIENAFERIKILMENKAIPYVTRHVNYNQSPYKGMYITLARWTNQPSIFKKKSFRQFCEMENNASAMRYAQQFEHDYPDIAAKYFDIRFETA